MIHKKPGVSCSTLALLQALQCYPQPSSSCRTPSFRRSQRHERYYAQVAEDPSTLHDGAHIPWPDPIPPHKIPTPYQIFGLKKNEPYSKVPFNRLVKLYHPDRYQHEPLCRGDILNLPHHVRVERYRLIITAHAILSDPTKRSAYDRHGVGWAGHPSIDGFDPSAKYERRQWKPGEDPMYNATWEDWERWYNRDSKEPQSPLYVSNAMFVSIIVVLATLGGIGEATRAKKWSNNILAQRDIAHAEASRELRRAREAASAAGDHKDRIDAFLRHKDSTTYAEEAYRRLLPRQEACSSAEVESSER